MRGYLFEPTIRQLDRFVELNCSYANDKCCLRLLQKNRGPALAIHSTHFNATFGFSFLIFKFGFPCFCGWTHFVLRQICPAEDYRMSTHENHWLHHGYCVLFQHNTRVFPHPVHLSADPALSMVHCNRGKTLVTGERSSNCCCHIDGLLVGLRKFWVSPGQPWARGQPKPLGLTNTYPEVSCEN